MERMTDKYNYEKKISIIVPVYNVEKYLERCIDSLLNQDLPHDDYEIIMINDGSTDNSGKMAERLANENANVSLIHQENQGLSGARNTGIKHAKGRYLMFVDSDDYIEPNSLKPLVDFAEEHHLDICNHQFMVVQADGNVLHFDKSQYANGKVYNGKVLLLNGMAMTSACHGIYSSRLLEETGLLFTPGILHEDIDFNMRIYPHARKVMYMDLEVYYYCMSVGSIMRTEDRKKRKHLMKSKFDVGANMLRLGQQTEDKEVADYYVRNACSTVFGSVLSLMAESIMDKDDRKECINHAHALGVYPICHRTLSIKSTLLLPIVNCYPFLELLKAIGLFKEQKKAVWEQL